MKLTHYLPSFHPWSTRIEEAMKSSDEGEIEQYGRLKLGIMKIFLVGEFEKKTREYS